MFKTSIATSTSSEIRNTLKVSIETRWICNWIKAAAYLNIFTRCGNPFWVIWKTSQIAFVWSSCIDDVFHLNDAWSEILPCVSQCFVHVDGGYLNLNFVLIVYCLLDFVCWCVCFWKRKIKCRFRKKKRLEVPLMTSHLRSSVTERSCPNAKSPVGCTGNSQVQIPVAKLFN